MTITNNNIKQVDLPVWEWCRFAPALANTYSSLCTGGENQRYIYYMVGAILYRYDTYSDGWQQLATSRSDIMVPYTGGISMEYTNFGGFRGNVLSAGASTVNIPAARENAMVGYKIRITGGTGIGQERTITAVSDPIIADTGLMTAIVGSVNGFTDNTKKWKTNQWVGYHVRVTFGSGINMVRKVLYNDSTNIYIFDQNHWGLEQWNNTPYYVNTPQAIPAYNNSQYQIEQSVVTVDTPWTVQPDASSTFVVMTGGLWVTIGTQQSSYLWLYFYDLLTDTWMLKTAPPSLFLSVNYMSSNINLKLIDESTGILLNGNISAATTKTVTTDQTLVAGRWANHQIRITAGIGIGQSRRIVSNSNGANALLYLATAWDTNPDATSQFAIYPDTKLYINGSYKSSMYQYLIEEDMWVTGSAFETGYVKNASGLYPGQEAFGITTAVRQTTSVTVLNATPTVGGTGYAVGDIFNITGGTTLAQGRVETIAANGVVLTVSLYNGGNGYSTGTGKATTNAIGIGTTLTVNITTVGLTGKITFALNHNLKIGDSLTVKGATEAAWNSAYTVTGTPSSSLAIAEVVTIATADLAFTATTTTTLIVDCTKNWGVNEHAGKVIGVYTINTYQNPTYQSRRIISNTATTITVATMTLAINGLSKYVIQSSMAFGRDIQYKQIERGSSGWASSGTSVTLVDSTKQWQVNQWAGYKVRIISGTGWDNQIGELAITANDATTLTITTPGFTADATTQYQIQDTFGICTTSTSGSMIYDTNKNWVINQWLGKSVRVMGGIANTYMYDAIISSNTATTLSFAGVGYLDATSSYCILSENIRVNGSSLNWIHSPTLTINKGRYLITCRGFVANYYVTSWGKYDLASELFDVSLMHFPTFGENLGAGSMYTYDKKDTIYIQVTNTGRVLAYNTHDGTIRPCGMIPYGMGSVIEGNRMEFITTVDGFKYLYIMRHSGNEMWRMLIHWE